MNIREKIKNLAPKELELLLQKAKKTPAAPLEEKLSRYDRYFPLSYGQQRLWLQAQIENQPLIHNISLAMMVMTPQPIEKQKITHIINTIIGRHEILRTTFHLKKNTPVQYIHHSLIPTVVFEDVQCEDPAQRVQEAKRRAIELAKKPFNLEKGPLIRFAVYQSGTNEYLFVLITHHLVSDGWSNQLFFGELAKGLFSQKMEPSAPHQYLDYVFWEQNRFQGSNVERHISFWKENLGQESPVTRFPQEGLTSPQVINTCRQKTFWLHPELCSRIHEFSRVQKSTVFVILLAVFKVLIHRYTQQDDLIIGIPYANRRSLEFQQTMGLFINIIPFRSQVRAQSSFLDYFKELRRLSTILFSHSDIPFNLIVDAIRPERRAGGAPFFNLLFVHQNFPQAYAAPGIEITPEYLDINAAQYNFTFVVEEAQNKIAIHIKYKEEAFDSFFADQIYDHFTNLLRYALKHPEQRIGVIPMISLHEKDELLMRAKHPEARLEPMIRVPVFKAFEAQVEKTPNALAVESMEGVLTYAQLNEGANRLARTIQTFLLKQESSVGLLLERSDSFVIAMLAVMKCGLTALPIDQSFPKERIKQMMKETKAQLMVTSASLHSRIEHDSFSSVVLDRDQALIAVQDKRNVGLEIPLSQLAYTIFTSGSSGKPKGVAIEQGQLAAYLESIDWETADLGLKRFCFNSTIAADIGYTQLFLPLINGGCVVMVPKEIGEDPDRFSLYVQEHPVDCLKAVPSQLVFLLKGKSPRNVLPNKLLILAGETTPTSLIKEIRRVRPECRVFMSYGPTEATVGAMTYPFSDEEQWFSNPRLLGHPNLNTEVYILDQNRKLVPIGVPGDIYLGGPCVARGYINQPLLTQEHFIPSPFSKVEGARLYKTGDCARFFKDGTIEFLGRKDRQVKVRGYRIELGEVESSLLRLPEVQQAVVKVIDETLFAFITLNQGVDVSVAELKKALKLLVPPHMVPGRMIHLEKLPLTPCGKIDDKALCLENNVQETAAKKLPRDALEMTLVMLWEKILKVDHIGVDESFFELGGHSFLALELMLQIERELEVRMPLAALFESPTIELLAQTLRTRSLSYYQKPIVRLKEGKGNPSMFFVHPAGGQVLCYYDLATNLKGDCAFYGVQSPFVDDATSHTNITIEDIASSYLQHLFGHVKEEGSLLVGGWSLGGIIAFEMAAQLASQKGRLPPVVILDQPIPALATQRDVPPLDDYNYVLRFLSQVSRFNEIEWEIDVAWFEGKSFREQVDEVYQMFVAKRLVPRDVTADAFFSFLTVQKLQSFAALRYVPKRYEGSVLLLRAETSQWEGHGRFALGWETVVSDLRVKQLCGTHMSIMKAPRITDVTEEIESWLLKISTFG